MMNHLEKYAAKKRLTEKLAEKVELEPDRLRRAMAGGTLGVFGALPASVLTAMITKNPQFLKGIAKGTVSGAGIGALLGQAFPIMKEKGSGRMRMRKATKGPRAGKMVFAREGEEV